MTRFQMALRKIISVSGKRQMHRSHVSNKYIILSTGTYAKHDKLTIHNSNRQQSSQKHKETLFDILSNSCVQQKFNIDYI